MKFPSSLGYLIVVQLFLLIVHLNHHLCYVEATCSGTTFLNATRSKQYLTTPNYGESNYPPNMDCYYVMKADTEDRILIEVLDVDMEAQLFRSCLDFVGFHEASTPKHFMRPYLSFCGQLKYRQVTSKTDSVTIQFFSDELVEGRGVRISYEAVSYGMCETNWLHRNDGTCYRYLEANPKLGWADAQDQCSQMQANLAVVRNQQDLEYMSIHN